MHGQTWRLYASCSSAQSREVTRPTSFNRHTVGLTLYSHLFPTTPCTMAETRLAFKAGRAFRRDNTNFVDPDPTKGAILIQNGEDTLLHFIWKNRSNSEVEEVRFCSTVLSILGCAHVRVTLVAYAK